MRLHARTLPVQRAYRAVCDAFNVSVQPVEGRLLPSYRWARAMRLGCCRAGLHFLGWSDQCDGYACECRRIVLGAEHIR